MSVEPTKDVTEEKAKQIELVVSDEPPRLSPQPDGNGHSFGTNSSNLTGGHSSQIANEHAADYGGTTAYSDHSTQYGTTGYGEHSAQSGTIGYGEHSAQSGTTGYGEHSAQYSTTGHGEHSAQSGNTEYGGASAPSDAHKYRSDSIFANSPQLQMVWGEAVAPRVDRKAVPEDVQRMADQIEETTKNFLSNFVYVLGGGLILVVFFIIVSFIGVVRNWTGHTEATPTFDWNIFSNLTAPPALGFVKNANMEGVLFWLPFALFGCCIAVALASVFVYYTRPREITCDDKNLILEGSGPLMIGVRWNAIKRISQSRTWDIFNGKRDVLTAETMGGHTFRMRVTDIARKQDISTFFNRVRTNAPHAVLEIADEIRNAEPSYTELWLKYFSAPSERNNKGLLEPGMTLDSGRYTVVQTVGGGGQGTAYLAVCKQPVTRLDETCQHFAEDVETSGLIKDKMEVVLKEYVLPVHRGKLTAEKTAEKLKAEAEILRKLEHPQIVKLLDGFIEDYRGYLVLEYVQGETLKSIVDRLGPQPESAVIAWATQVADILSYLHSLTPSVVHRDITPDNLILQEDGTIKVVDFNVAHQVDSSATATVVGKHAYIPPEQFRGKPTEQSDIYALGGTMYFLLTGSEPEPISVARPRTVSNHVSEKLDALVAKCTSLDLTRRFEHANELASELRKLQK